MFACRKLQIIRNHDWFVTKHGERRSLRGLLTDYRTDNGSQFANSDTCYRVITCPAGGVKRSSVARITPLRPWGTQSRMRVRFRSDARLNSLALDDTTPVEHTPYYRADPPPLTAGLWNMHCGDCLPFVIRSLIKHRISAMQPPGPHQTIWIVVKSPYGRKHRNERLTDGWKEVDLHSFLKV